MKKPLPILEVAIEKLVHGGQGIGTLPDGRKIFVWGALPGEVVNVQLTKKKRDYAEGYTIEVLQPSKDRIEPKEPEIYVATSPWQIIAYDIEADYKQKILQETFVRENIDATWQSFYQQDNPYNYRNKMEYNFWFDTETEQVSLALHRRGSHQKISVNDSALASVEINAAGKELISYINTNSIEARPLKSVIIRSDTNGTVGISLFVNDKIVAKRFSEFNLDNAIFEILYSDPRSPASISTEVIRTSEQQLSDTLLGKPFTYSTRSFFQVNISVYEKVLQIIANEITIAKEHAVIDMYSGVGSIGLSVVPENKKLIMVEIEEESTNQAKNNSKDRNNTEVITATAESATDYISNDAVIILDPPRAGLHKDVTEKLIETLPNKVIYLSCNPSTQARDVKQLLEAGYKISFAQGFNFFPRTPHIESLLFLTKQ